MKGKPEKGMYDMRYDWKGNLRRECMTWDMFERDTWEGNVWHEIGLKGKPEKGMYDMR